MYVFIEESTVDQKIETNKEKGFANLEFCRPQSMPRTIHLKLRVVQDFNFFTRDKHYTWWTNYYYMVKTLDLY
jgi:hypothetical protein